MKKFTALLPDEIMEELQLLKVLHDRPMREIVIEAIKLFSNQPQQKKQMRDLKHRVYRLEYDKQ